MAKLIYGMNQSLDGYVDHLEFSPNLALFRHSQSMFAIWPALSTVAAYTR
jgi:hypothetical protein